MNTEVLAELTAFSQMPLARVPRASLADWFAFFRGNRSMDGIPIPVRELPVGPLLRPALDRVEPGRLQLAVNELLIWLSRADRSAASDTFTDHYLNAVSILLDACPALNELFVGTNGRVAFRSHVPDQTRDAIASYVRAHYRPLIRR